MTTNPDSLTRVMAEHAFAQIVALVPPHRRDHARWIADQCLAALSAQGVEGYVLVPREPTDEMLHAASNAQDYHDRIGPYFWRKAWPAMLSAAHAPAVGGGDKYKELVADLREQSAWWKEQAKEAKTPEGRAVFDGCAMKLAYLVERRDDSGNIKPTMKAAAKPSAPAVGGRQMTGTVADIPDAELLRRAVCHLAPRARRQPAWARIMDVFGLGSTYSAQLCQRFGRHPDTGKVMASELAAKPSSEAGETNDE